MKYNYLTTFYISKEMRKQFYKSIKQTCKHKIKCEIENIEANIIHTHSQNIRVAYSIGDFK